MRLLIPILLAAALLLQPIAALGQRTCDCASTMGDEGSSPGFIIDTDACCPCCQGEGPSDNDRAPQDPEDQHEHPDCPKSCCSYIVVVGCIHRPAPRVTTKVHASWEEPAPRFYPDAPVSGLKRPPRPLPLV